MNKQELFNKVATHLIQQGKPAAEITDSEATGKQVACFYRGPEGTKCAVGCLISDEVYTEELEGFGSKNMYVQQALKQSGVNLDDDSLALLSQLQTVHDSSVHSLDYLETIKGLLESTAHDFKLDTEVLNVTSC